MSPELVAESLRPEALYALLQNGWTLVCAALVLFMQAGFCVLEAGTVRHKNSINVALKNVLSLLASFPGFYLVGYALMFGASDHGYFGKPVAVLANVSLDELTKFFFQAAFCSTAATIVSGGVAERCRFLPYLLVTFVVSVAIYPLLGHAVWGGGKLAQIGFHDFAGSAVVHTCGAGVALAGIQVLGPRLDRFGPDGKPSPMPASSMPMVALGVLLLVFCWVGFNGGSAPLGPQTARIIVNTVLAACFGGLSAMLITWASRGIAAVDLTLNGVLGGLVAITACADAVTLHAAALVGVLGGLSVVLVTVLLEKLQLDDAVGAVPVHGGAGITGLLATGVFGDAALFEPLGLSRLDYVGVQATGALAAALWAYGAGYVAWRLIGKLAALRVGPVEESVGMNFSEHGVLEPELAQTHAVQGLMRDVAQLQRRQDQWTLDLDAISSTLDLNQRIGREAMEIYREELTHLDRSLYLIARALADGRVDPRALAIAADSVLNLRRRLDLLGHKFPSTMDSWEQINRMAERLDRLSNSMRGEVLETH